MKEILLDPGFIAVMVVTIPAFFAYLQSNNSKRDKFRKSKLTTEQKRVRITRWYQENYHRARMLMIQNNLGEVVAEHLPFEPPDNLMEEPYKEEA